MFSFLRRHARVMAVGVSCAAVGAGASAIATAGAATSTAPPSGSHTATHARRGALARALARRAVQGQAVVRTRQGWATISFERGTVDSVSGDQLTLTEGTPRASYRTVTLTIPADARVRDDGRLTGLSALTHGQRALVLQAPARTYVVAHTPRTGG